MLFQYRCKMRVSLRKGDLNGCLDSFSPLVSMACWLEPKSNSLHRNTSIAIEFNRGSNLGMQTLFSFFRLH